MVLTVSPDKVLVEAPTINSFAKESSLNVILVNHAEFGDKGRVVLLLLDGDVNHQLLIPHVQFLIVQLVNPPERVFLSLGIGVISSDLDHK